MKKTRFTETKIISILKEVEAGMLAKDVCLTHCISVQLVFSARRMISKPTINIVLAVTKTSIVV